MRNILYVLVFLMFQFCVHIAVAAEPIHIEKMTVTPKTIDLSKDEKAVLEFETTRASFLSISFRDENANPLNHFELGLKPAGKQMFVWNGRMENGETVKTNVVVYSIDARTEDNQYAHYNPSIATGGDDLKFPKFTLDKKTGKVEYILPRAARVRLRAGILEGALFKTLFDWKPEEAGKREFMWDGGDKSGEIDLLNYPKLNMNLNAFSLPDNAIIVTGAEVNYMPPDSVYQEIKQGKHFHYSHPRMTCHEPRFKITFPDALNKDENGVLILKGKTPISVEIDPKDQADLVRRRFEVMVYLDMLFLFEEEQAVTPATFFLDASSWAPGYHLLTVNVMSYDDHIGVETVKVRVNP